MTDIQRSIYPESYQNWSRKVRTKKDPTFGLSLNDVTKGRNEGEFANSVSCYELPKPQAAYKAEGPIREWKNEPKQGRVTYFAELMAKKKSGFFKVPGPADYKSEQSFDSITLHTTKKHVWPKGKRNMFTDEIIKRENYKKGPGEYKYETRKKVLGQSKISEEKLLFIGDIMNHSKQVPAPNNYKPKWELSSLKRRSLSRDFSLAKPMRSLSPIKQKDGISPVTYGDS